jgi:hypothetical protein
MDDLDEQTCTVLDEVVGRSEGQQTFEEDVHCFL